MNKRSHNTFVDVPHKVPPDVVLRDVVRQEIVGPPDALLGGVPEHVRHRADVPRLHGEQGVARQEGPGWQFNRIRKGPKKGHQMGSKFSDLSLG